MYRTEDQSQFLHEVVLMAYDDYIEQWLSKGERVVYQCYKRFSLHFVDAGEASWRNINSEGDLVSL